MQVILEDLRPLPLLLSVSVSTPADTPADWRRRCAGRRAWSAPSRCSPADARHRSLTAARILDSVTGAQLDTLVDIAHRLGLPVSICVAA